MEKSEADAGQLSAVCMKFNNALAGFNVFSNSCKWMENKFIKYISILRILSNAS